MIRTITYFFIYMKLQENYQNNTEIPFMLGSFGLLPHIKKDSRDKIMQALDEITQIEEKPHIT